MAELQYNDYPESVRVPLSASVASAMNWLGAGLSLALIGGVALWGYQLLVRDVTGVPVVRALEGPMRIAPEDPGGSRAAFQGLAVNEIAAEGTAAEPPEMVVLAPPAPELAEEDRALAALLPDEPDAPLPAVTETRKVSAIDLAVAEALGESPLVMLASASADEVEALSNPDVIPASVAGVARSPRPEPRPEGRIAAQVASLEPTLPAAAFGGIDADPAAIEPGARLVQLGAFPTEDVARQEWDRIASRFGDFMADKKRVIQEAEAGGRRFYRLRVLGFEDLSDSRRFCAVLIAGEASCIPVAWR